MMPCYNASAHVESAVRSILNQSHRNVELIVVDDASTDKSREILTELAHRDVRIRLIANSTRRGPGFSRNIGIQRSTGTYLAFCDADDKVLPNAYTKMIETLEGSGSDFVIGGYRRHGESDGHRPGVVKRVHRERLVGMNLDKFPHIIDEPVIWNRLYVRQFWTTSGAVFPENLNYEDQLPALRTARVGTFDVLQEDVYSWRLPDGRNTRSRGRQLTRNLVDRIEMSRRLRSEVAQSSDDTRNFLERRINSTDMMLHVEAIPAANDEFFRIIKSALSGHRSGHDELRSLGLPLKAQLALWAVSSMSRLDVERLLGFWQENTGSIPVSEDANGFLEVDGSWIRRLDLDIPSDVRRVREEQLRLKTRFLSSRRVGRKIEIRFSAYVDGLQIGENREVLVVSPAGAYVARTAEPDHVVNLHAGDPWRDYSNSVFTAIVDDASVAELALLVRFKSAQIVLEERLYLPKPIVDLAVKSSTAGSLVYDDDTAPRAIEVVYGEISNGSVRLGLRAQIPPSRLVLKSRSLHRVSESPQLIRDGEWYYEFRSEHRALPSGAFYVHAVPKGRDSHTAERVSAAPILSLRPMDEVSEFMRLAVSADARGSVTVSIGPPLSSFERSRFGRRVLMEKNWGVLRPSIFFESFNGKSISDVPLAIYESLTSISPGIDTLWSTSDYARDLGSVSKIVCQGTEAWYEALASSRVLVNNNHFPASFRKNQDQFYLQTWHGTPIKRLLGHMNANEVPLTYRRIMERESSDWDLLLAESALAESNLRTGLAYAGPVRRIPDPRAVLLDSGPEREEFRERLGVAREEIVILYAPTWRNESESGEWLVDTRQLSADVGVPVLFRAHHMTAPIDASQGSSIDVSSVSPVEKLISAADILVSDYSSIIYTWAYTGKPICLHLPDIDAYRSDRGFVVEWPPQESCVSLDYDSLVSNLNTCVQELRGGARRGAVEMADDVRSSLDSLIRDVIVPELVGF
ncbi:bifunctional glycosyltransferase/CDP-glycerol:glycerophosphate glycerophosphotransferase [Paraoerskovia marina]|uniref:bifunctional glycosyltransferase/CDP-glycerol:glycerophosphate glycerophosphotransferase n=1 Tax=Paraoerskovia marina TaxID=545619 RepID=UPI0022B25B1A|nr:CDP-glycerol glycerophosphotransferase family protein [Paraoerskovia marina]